MSKKIYVIDTNVLMYAGKKALTSFEDNEVVIPFVVVEELEKKRLEDGLSGVMARYALREIDSLRVAGKLKEGIVVNKDGGILRVEMNHKNTDTLPKALRDGHSNDIRILTVANNLHLEEQEFQKEWENNQTGREGKQVVLITNDVPLRIKADSLFDMKIEPFYVKGSQYSGLGEINVSTAFINQLFEARKNGDHNGIEAPEEMLKFADGIANHAFILKDWGSGKGPLATLSGNRVSLANMKISAMKSVEGKSNEQKIALNYLMDPSKTIVSLGGKAGTGKTLMSVVSGIEQIEGNHPRFRKIVVIRPIYSVGGQDIGFLPGDADDKMEPWRKAIYDSVEGIVDSNIINKLNEEGKIDVMPATFLRGRTFHDTFCIVDESQNFEPSVLLTILSRIGEGSKIVFLWDATQKDNGKVGYNDGIVSVIDKLKGSPMFAHISLTKSERSPVAELAGNILEDYIN